MKQYDFERLGHGALKEYVYDYSPKITSALEKAVAQPHHEARNK
jgi:hypothetical protein